MKKQNEDNSIHIGSKNKIENSVIGNKNVIVEKSLKNKKRWYSKFIWKLIVPVLVVVIGTLICYWLGYNK